MSRLEADVDGQAAESDETLVVVVLAAHGLSLTANRPSTYNGDRVAVHPNGDVHVLDLEAEQGQELGRHRSVSVLYILAALHGAGVAGGVGAAAEGGDTVDDVGDVDGVADDGDVAADGGHAGEDVATGGGNGRGGGGGEEGEKSGGDLEEHDVYGYGYWGLVGERMGDEVRVG